VHASSSGDFVVAGWSGTTAYRGSGGWRIGATGPLLFDVADGPGGTRFAVGNAGSVYREAGTGWTPLPIPTRQTLFGASRQNEELLVVGDSGVILRYDGAQWKDESVAAPRLLRSVWTDEAGAAFVVGERGTTIRRQGSAWVAQTPVTTRFLRHVFGFDASHAYAVGDSGTALAWNGTEWRDMGLTSNALLRGIWGSAPDDLFAVGSGGAVFRYDGVRWYSMESPTTRELRTVWGFGPTEVYAAGEEGVILRFNGSAWSVVPTTNRLLILSLEPAAGGKLTAVGARGLVLEGQR
jgi:hypothetical protein